MSLPPECVKWRGNPPQANYHKSNNPKEYKNMTKMILLFEIIAALFLGFSIVFGSNLNKAMALSLVIYWILDTYLRNNHQ